MKTETGTCSFGGNKLMDRFKLHSGLLSVEISPIGGELRSLQYGDAQLLWQGDPAYWDASAPFLFPFCGRVKDGVYRWQGAQYPMTIHGFLPHTRLTVSEYTNDRLVLTLADTPETKTIYPFPFGLTMDYRLTDDGLEVSATVTAEDTELPFSFGCHPGFNLPLGDNDFGEATLRFDSDIPLTRIEITENGLLGDGRSVYPLHEHTLPLSPDPAGGCGIFFEIPEKQRALALTAPSLPCEIQVDFADFPVLGLWHAEGAPYLCIEPWQGLPAPDGILTDLANKPETIILAPHETKTLTMRIRLLQKG
jgi:galactose mutarotase-like enzyme